MAAAEKKVSPEEDKEGDEDQTASGRLTASGSRLPDDSPLRQIQTTGKSIVSERLCWHPRLPRSTTNPDHPPSTRAPRSEAAAPTAAVRLLPAAPHQH